MPERRRGSSLLLWQLALLVPNPVSSEQELLRECVIHEAPPFWPNHLLKASPLNRILLYWGHLYICLHTHTHSIWQEIAADLEFHKAIKIPFKIEDKDLSHLQKQNFSPSTKTSLEEIYMDVFQEEAKCHNETLTWYN
jgi:hypothetical protein